MMNAMTHKDAAEKRQLESELRTASEIQRILLPDENPQVPGYRICGTNKPARIVSGDYFDYIAVDETTTGVAIADVSGKGVAASLLTAMCRSVLRVAAPANLSPANALARLNRILYPDIREDMFISLAYLLVDHANGSLVLGRAGHDAPLLFHAATGEVERVQCPGLALGVDEGPVFERVTRDFPIVMEKGDLLLLYTDGVNEALNVHGDEFGLERLKDVIRTHAPAGAPAVVAAVTASVAAFVGDHPQSDDITLIAVEKR
jgi:sigma-B regulation protein RsbU (phosphoserine phosphatase)